MEDGGFDSSPPEHEGLYARGRRALGMPRRTELADHSNQRDTCSVLSAVQRLVRLGHRRESEVRRPATLGDEKRLRAELLFDAGVQRRVLLQRGSRDEVALQTSHERLPGRYRKL